MIDAALVAQRRKRDLPRQHLDGAPLCDDAAPALAGGGEDAGDDRQFRHAARALAAIPNSAAVLRMGQDRTLQGARLHAEWP